MSLPEVVEYIGKNIQAFFVDGQVIEGQLDYCPGRDMNKRLHSYFKIGSRIFKVSELEKIEEVRK